MPVPQSMCAQIGLQMTLELAVYLFIGLSMAYWLVLMRIDDMKQLKTKLLIVRLTEKQLQTINVIAEKHGQTKSEFTRTHFLNLLNNYNEKTDNKI